MTTRQKILTALAVVILAPIGQVVQYKALDALDFGAGTDRIEIPSNINTGSDK